MDERNLKPDQTLTGAEPVNYQLGFDFGADLEKQQRTWDNLAAIRDGIEATKGRIRDAENHNQRTWDCIAELNQLEPGDEWEAGRSEPEIDLSGSPHNAERQHHQSEKGVEL